MESPFSDSPNSPFNTPQDLPASTDIFLSDIDGLTPTQEAAPVYVPANFGQQYVIVSAGGSAQVFIYDSENATWLNFTSGLPTILWNRYGQVSWSASTFAKSFAALPAHDMWKLVLYFNGGDANSQVGLRLNGDSSANYSFNKRNNAQISGTTYILLLDTSLRAGASGDSLAGEITITGRVNQNTQLNTVHEVTNGPIGPTAVASIGLYNNASTDLSEIDFVFIAGTDSWTGKAELFYQDLT